MSKKADKYAAGAASLADDLAEFQTAEPQTYPDLDEPPEAPVTRRRRTPRATPPRSPKPSAALPAAKGEERLKPGPTPPAYRAQAHMVAFGSKMTAETKETLRQLKAQTGKAEIDLVEEALQSLFAAYRKKGVSI